MAAAFSNSMVDDRATRSPRKFSTTSKNPAEYPLTMGDYAMVPTSGLSQSKADAIARWLRFVACRWPAAGAGTAPGDAADWLPAADAQAAGLGDADGGDGLVQD